MDSIAGAGDMAEGLPEVSWMARHAYRAARTGPGERSHPKDCCRHAQKGRFFLKNLSSLLVPVSWAKALRPPALAILPGLPLHRWAK